MYTQDEFSYFGDDNSDNPDEEIDVGEGDSERQESFNQNGKRVRGKDQEFREVFQANSVNLSC